MFLVLIEYTEDDESTGWSVVAHGRKGLWSVFSTRKEAEETALKKAKEQTNRFAVVEIKSWFQQEVQRIEVKETRIG